MGLKITPKSQLRALNCRIYSWKSLKMVFHHEPILIAWSDITEVLVISKGKTPSYHMQFKTTDGFESNLHFFANEVENKDDFEIFLAKNPEKIRIDRLGYFREQMVDSVRPYLRYGAVSTKWIISLLALTFMFFQMKYFGSILIQKYQFLIKASCNQQCANELWSISTLWFYALIVMFTPLIPILFYKKIYSAASKSKNIQVINVTITETFTLAAIGALLLISASPKIWNSTTKYTKVLAAYSDGTLQTKLSQKVEMASKREFQGDVDDVEGEE